MSGHDDDFGDSDGDDGAQKVPDLAMDTFKSILDALCSG